MFQCRIDVLLPFSNPATSSSLDRPLHWHLSRSDELPLWALSQGLEEVSLSFTTKCLCHTTHFFQMQNWCVRFWRCVWVSAEQQSCDTSRTEQRWHLQLKCHHNCQTWVNISGRQIFLQPPSLQWWVNKVSVQRTTPEPLVRWRLGESSGNNHCFQFCQYLRKVLEAHPESQHCQTLSHLFSAPYFQWGDVSEQVRKGWGAQTALWKVKNNILSAGFPTWERCFSPAAWTLEEKSWLYPQAENLSFTYLPSTLFGAQCRAPSQQPHLPWGWQVQVLLGSCVPTHPPSLLRGRHRNLTFSAFQ